MLRVVKDLLTIDMADAGTEGWTAMCSLAEALLQRWEGLL